MDILRTYYQLAKPGIIYGNATTTVAAFLFASQWHFSLTLFLATILSIAFVIGSAAVANNIIDRKIDIKMERTRGRALVVGKVGPKAALIYSIVLGFFGFSLLLYFVNIVTATVAVVGFIFYVVCYSVAKRASHWGTEVGSIAGATPIVVGYTAVTGTFDLCALLLFLILVLWQMPHFFGIALYHMDEYKAAGIPVLPLARSVVATKRATLGYLVGLILVLPLLTVFHYVGYTYFVVMTLVSLVWLYNSIYTWRTFASEVWGRKVFGSSIIVLMTFCVVLAVAPFLP